MSAVWDTAADPAPLLRLAQARPAPAPAFLLFTAASCRLVEHLAPDPAWLPAIDQAERFAAGLLAELMWGSFPEWYHQAGYPARDVALAFSTLFPYPLGAVPNLVGAPVHAEAATGHVASALACEAAGPAPPDCTPDHPWHAAWQAGYTRALAALADLARCVFGPPEPAAVHPDWLTRDVLGLAAACADRRAFDTLPILADALEDAGCDCPELLAHCRTAGPHGHGCWALDRVLARG